MLKEFKLFIASLLINFALNFIPNTSEKTLKWFLEMTDLDK